MKQSSRMLLAILALSAATHLTFLSWPREVVFDEFHFGRQVTSLGWTAEPFFDVHPPHAKLLIAAVARVAGYDGGFTFDRIGKPYGGVSPWPLRLLPALAGAALPLLLFRLLRQLGATPACCFLGGLLLAFENALIVQSRFVSMDAILICFTLAALSLHLAARAVRGGRRLLLLCATGLCCGMAAGSKLTGLAALGLVGIVSAVDLAGGFSRRRAAAWLGEGLLVAGCAGLAYLAGWVAQLELLGNPAWPGILREILDQNLAMVRANAAMVATHPHASPWWSWPVMGGPIFLWWDTANAGIFLFGNPLAWLGSTALLAAMLGSGVAARLRGSAAAVRAGAPRPVWIPVAGYCVAYLPLAAVSRILFMYHYLMPLTFAVAAGLLWLDARGWTLPGPLRRQRKSYHAAIALCVLLFALLAPVTYGFPPLDVYRDFWRTVLGRAV